MKQELKEIATFSLVTLSVGLILGIIIGGWLYSGPSTDQVKAIYDLGRLERCWECYQALDKDAPPSVVRFHANGDCVKEGKPW